VGASTGANAYANGQLFLWVRNYTNAAIPQAPDGTLAQGPNLLTAFKRGGEQHIITIRKSGALGRNEAMWPDASGN